MPARACRARAARLGHGADRRRDGARRRRHGLADPDEPHPRARLPQPLRHRPAGPHQPLALPGHSRARLLFRARSLQPDGLLHRRQRLDQRGRPALPQVRHHGQPRAGARGRHGRGRNPDGGRQGARPPGLRPHGRARGRRGDARPADGDHGAAPPRAGRREDPAGVLLRDRRRLGDGLGDRRGGHHSLGARDDRRDLRPRHQRGRSAGYPKGAGAVLLIELDGPTAEIEAQAGRIVQICRDHAALEIRVAQDEAERALLWKGRKEAAGAVGRMSPSWILQDAVVPRSRLPEIMREVQAIGARHRLVIANVFHAGDGNLHPMILYNDVEPGELERAMLANDELLRACIAMGGSVTGEHGVGLDKASSMPLQFGDADLNFMARFRRVFDPDGIMNPGKLLPSHPACGEGFRPSAPRLPAGTWV